MLGSSPQATHHKSGVAPGPSRQSRHVWGVCASGILTVVVCKTDEFRATSRAPTRGLDDVGLVLLRRAALLARHEASAYPHRLGAQSQRHGQPAAVVNAARRDDMDLRSWEGLAVEHLLGSNNGYPAGYMLGAQVFAHSGHTFGSPTQSGRALESTPGTPWGARIILLGWSPLGL